MGSPAAVGEDSNGSVVLSTGQRVSLPLLTETTMTAVVFSAALDGVGQLLPPALSPVRIGPRRGMVMFLCTEYHSIDGGAIEPYHEFGVLVPSMLPGSGVVGRFGGMGGYVWYLPVTTESARALGDIWGYPKEVGSVEITDTDSHRSVSVAVDGEPFITVAVARPPSLPASMSFRSRSYTVHGDDVLGVPLSFDGEIGAWPLSTRASYTLGTHPRAAVLDELSIGNRALLRCHGRVTFVVHPGTPIKRGRPRLQ